MRILHVIDSSGVYGAEMVVLALMESQKKYGNVPVILSLKNKGNVTKGIEVEAKKQQFELLTLRIQKGFSFKGAKKIIEIARSIEADIIHSHGYKPDILLGFLGRRQRSLPVISTIHGWTATTLYSKLGIYRLLDAVAMTRLEKVISVSSVNLDNPLFRILGIRPAVVNNGIPYLKFESEFLEIAFPEIAKACKERFSIISVGRLSREKGFSVLIKAVWELVKAGQDVFLVLAGEGAEKVRLQELTKEYCISERVAFLGYQNEAYRLMPHFDVFVLPSLTEGLPVTMLEAMQAGIPIVGTRVGEVPEMLENGTLGELAIPNNSGSLAWAIQKVFVDKESARKKALLCQAKAVDKYSIKSMCHAYSLHYNHVIQNWSKSL